jgi:class 3 adenylate cyclase/predicted ATPase
MRCTSCGFENPKGMSFCGKCGTSLTPSCPRCGFVNPADFAFCGKCGSPLAQPLEKSQPVKGKAKAAPKRTKRKRRNQTTRPATEAPRPVGAEAERRQLTVMFCDLVGSTALSEQLDPEDYREVIQAYNEVCATAIKRFDGHLAKYLGDGLLIYFGYPVAHEDDAQRAVRAGLEIIRAIREQGIEYRRQKNENGIGTQHAAPLQVRIGIHTGLVVAGEMGAGDTREPLAIVGETPNLAARLQGLAEPNTVVLSAATHRLVRGYIDCRSLGTQTLKGLSTPVEVYEVHGESRIQSRFELAVTTGLTPLVGREDEVRLLVKRWEKAKEGQGQVVLLRGEAGIGKSRLARAVRERIAPEPHTWLTVHCSPFHQNSAFYPIIEVLQRVLAFRPDDPPEEKLGKLGNALLRTGMNLEDSVPLLASLLAIPSVSSSQPSLTPQKQREKTLNTLVSLVVQETKLQPVWLIWEDLHWVDPSSLEFINLLIEQAPTTRLLMLLTCRPEFTPTWALRSHITQLTLSRLGRMQVEAMVEKVAAAQVLPSETIRQIVTKADGVPLFVEELTKTMVETLREQSIGDRGQGAGSVGTQLAAPVPALGIPVTLHDALMARLDRLGGAKEVAQLGATLGREFPYELLQAVSILNESALQRALQKLVESELLYQRGLLPQAYYVFKHALIQDAAYQSLLKSTRQRYHQQIAQVLGGRFPETKETQPELLAHHYTEAGLIAQAIPYWQQAGQRAAQRSANVEAIQHLTKGLGLLKTLPHTSEHAQQELALQATLGTTLIVTKGHASQEVERAYARALELCKQMGETPQLFPVLFRLASFHYLRAELQEAQELSEQVLRLAQTIQDPVLLLWPHLGLGLVLYSLGELLSARAHLEQSIALYNPQKHRPDRFPVVGQDPKVNCLSYASWTLCYLGYPDQARQRIDEALTVAKELSHPFSLAFALNCVAVLHQRLRDIQTVQERDETLLILPREQGFPLWLAQGTFRRGWVLVEQGRVEEGIGQMRQGLAAYRATGTELGRPVLLASLAEAHGKAGQAEEGVAVLAEALAVVDKTGECFYEAELYRLKGELTLQVGSQKSKGKSQKSLTLDSQSEAEAYFLKAIEIARKQQAKSLELRAATSLARLWQHQGKNAEAHKLLSDVYNWFTEGFATKDLQEAKALLAELS